MSQYEIIEKYVPTLGKPTYLIVGLPDAGLVGVIATEYLIDKLKLKEFAEIYAPDILPPISHVQDGVAKSPIRLYHNHNIVVFHSWIAIPSSAIIPLTKIIVDVARRYGISNIISITGLPIQDRLNAEKLNAYWIANNDETAQDLQKLGLMEKFGDGYIAGPYAPLLIESHKNNLANFVIVVESFLDLPDPEASAIAINILSKYIGFNINVDELLKEAEDIRDKIKGLMEQTKQELPTYASSRPMTYA
ncbi:proteasome assembly chaperone family protein [Sulfurisphaera javensis]|uniref:Proteasome assembly chaperone family protein n=1 Tax=Sulfurisphaera javensis TaxID=2049879 RepID=A0AAT9GUI5_9CREN